LGEGYFLKRQKICGPPETGAHKTLIVRAYRWAYSFAVLTPSPLCAVVPANDRFWQGRNAVRLGFWLFKKDPSPPRLIGFEAGLGEGYLWQRRMDATTGYILKETSNGKG
jgi:hypothetical protein